MAFVNEYVPDEDVKEYGLDEINRKYRLPCVQYDWTVDREREIYLRWLKSGGTELSDQHDFHLYWEKSLLTVRLKRTVEKDAYGSRTSRWQLMWIDIPDAFKDKRPEVLEVMKEALKAYKTSGIRSTTTSHTAVFEF